MDEKACIRTNGLLDCNPPVVRYSWGGGIFFKDRCCGVTFVFYSKKEEIGRMTLVELRICTERNCV